MESWRLMLRIVVEVSDWSDYPSAESCFTHCRHRLLISLMACVGCADPISNPRYCMRSRTAASPPGLVLCIEWMTGLSGLSLTLRSTHAMAGQLHHVKFPMFYHSHDRTSLGNQSTLLTMATRLYLFLLFH